MKPCSNWHPQTVTAYCASNGQECIRFGSWEVHPETGELFDISGES